MVRILKQSTSKNMHWLRRFGLWGFLLFLAKGLVWLGIAAWGLYQLG